MPIVDLCRFGVPDWVGDVQNPDAPAPFAFARRFPWVQLDTPVNEMFICATVSTRLGWWNEGLKEDRSFVTALKPIVKANGERGQGPARTINHLLPTTTVLA